MKRIGAPIVSLIKRAGLIPRSLAAFGHKDNLLACPLEEGQKLTEAFTEEAADKELTFQRLYFDAHSKREVKTESLMKLTQGTVLMLTIPGADTPTCTNIHLRNFIKHLPLLKSQGVTLAVLAKNDTDVMHKWLMHELRQAEWVKYDANLFFSPTLVQDHILAMSDIGLDILVNLGLKPFESTSLGLVYPRGLYLLHNGWVAKKNIEPDVAQCKLTSIDTALTLIKELQAKVNLRETNNTTPSAVTFATTMRKVNDKVKFYISLCSEHSVVNDPEIAEIDLSGQKIDNKDVALLMACIKSSGAFATLKSLDLSDCKGLTEVVIPVLPKLEKLNIGTPYLINYTLEGALPELREFSLDNSSRLTNDKVNIAEVFYKCPRLERFSYNKVALSRAAEELVEVFLNSHNNTLHHKSTNKLL